MRCGRAHQGDRPQQPAGAPSRSGSTRREWRRSTWTSTGARSNATSGGRANERGPPPHPHVVGRRRRSHARPQARRRVRRVRSSRRHRADRPRRAGLLQPGNPLSLRVPRRSRRRAAVLSRRDRSAASTSSSPPASPTRISSGAASSLPLGTIHLWARTFLWQDVLHRRIGVTNYASAGVDVAITLHFAADFADIYEVRGMRRAARGIDLDPVVGTDRVVLGYRGLDQIERRSVIAFSTAPAALDRESARFALSLPSGSERILDVSIACERERSSPDARSFAEAWREAEGDLERHRSRACHVRTGSERANAWFERASDDLHMLTTELRVRPVSLRGHPVVQHALRSRRNPHRVPVPVGASRARQGRAALPRFDAGHRARSRRRMQSRARSSTRRAPARWREPERCRSGGTTEPSTRRRSSSCWRVSTSGARTTSSSRARCGRTWRRRSSGSIASATGTATTSSSTSAARRTGCSIRAGRTRTTRSSTPTARRRRDRSRSRRCRATCTRRGVRRPSSPPRSAGRSSRGI